MSGTLSQALSFMKDNKNSMNDAARPTLYFIDDDMIRAPELRNDYELPYLQ